MKIFRKYGKNSPSSDYLLGLVELFLEGTATAEQEAELYAYFSSPAGGDADSRLERYRPMFAWYAALPGERMAAAGRRKRAAAAWAVAASVAVLMAVAGFLALWTPSAAVEAMELYAGSYVVRDGRRITDLRAIYPELRMAECLSDSLIAAAESAEFRAEDLERTLIEQAISHIDDSDLAATIRDELL